MTRSLVGTGVWSLALRYGDAHEAAAAAGELESLGYDALWIPDVGGDVFGAVGNLLAATTTAIVATGILNLWMHTAEETAAQHATLTSQHGRRFLVGIGVSHAVLIDRAMEAGTYQQPLAHTKAYLDALDSAVTPLAVEDRALAALGPKMLSLAATRTAGVHPYLVTPEHTHVARQAVGPDALVATEQGVILETDPERARSIARTNLARYFAMPNYTNNWKRLGFTDAEIADGGSNRLIDALVAWGDEAAIASRVQEHRDAGASHVCVQVLTDTPNTLPLEQWRILAPVLI
ncbi:MAG: LLM class F420-dependent oxidoreductase [Actinomycetota bacterium]|nr:LLM class F420-dependent oxidoreductase [Actinomycetota bacterium]